MKQIAINIRWRIADLAKVRKAAKLERISVSSFVRACAWWKAEEIIARNQKLKEKEKTA